MKNPKTLILQDSYENPLDQRDLLLFHEKCWTATPMKSNLKFIIYQILKT